MSSEYNKLEEVSEYPPLSTFDDSHTKILSYLVQKRLNLRALFNVFNKSLFNDLLSSDMISFILIELFSKTRNVQSV